MSYLSFINRNLKADFSTVYHDVFDKKDPDEFRATGSQVYHGRQRQGKTLGMVYGFHRLKRRYPKLLVVSNIHLNYLIKYETKKLWFFKFRKAVKYPLEEHRVDTLDQLKQIMDSEAFIEGVWQQSNYVYYQPYDSLLMLLRHARNGKWGVDFMIDEIHQYFHSHDSKSMPVWVSQIFSQQMKQYILIVGTVQKWQNVIKACREQIQHLIFSSRVGWYIRQQVVDPEDFENQYGEMLAPIKRNGGFFMSRIVRESYDTLALIESGREIFGGNETNMVIVSPTNQTKKPVGKSVRMR